MNNNGIVPTGNGLFKRFIIMRNSNWLITDVSNKRNDCVDFIKSNTVRLSEDRILQIHNLKCMTAEHLNGFWKNIPNNFKTHKGNLGAQ